MLGKRYTVEIVNTGMNGEGVARIDNLAVFIDGALLGEIVDVIITEKKKKFARAKVIKVVKSSPLRKEPDCNVFFKCGGCSLQHINYQSQLDIKRKQLISCLDKQITRNCEVDEVIPSDKEYGYRNKLQIPIGQKDNKIITGFYSKGSHEIVPTTECPLHGEWANEIIKATIDYANANKLTAYDEKTSSGLLRHLVARRVGEKYSVTLVINASSLPNYEDYKDRLISALGDNFSLYYSTNKSKTNVIMGDETTLLYGDNALDAQIMRLAFKVSPMSFMQVNDYIRDKIYKRVVEMIPEGNIVVDAYSGAGLLSALVAKKAKAVVSIEIVPQAIKDADRLMQNNDIHNVINILGDTKDVLSGIISIFSDKETYNSIVDNYRITLLALMKRLFTNEDEKLSRLISDELEIVDKDNLIQHLKQNSTIILDPPRKGCSQEALEAVIKLESNHIVYISCNPATLARDLAHLSPYYEITSITPYDMFPQTSHLETLVCMMRK